MLLTAMYDILMLKNNVDICAPISMEIVNNCIKNGTFVDELKFAYISPIFKSLDSTDGKNYKPILSLFS